MKFGFCRFFLFFPFLFLLVLDYTVYLRFSDFLKQACVTKNFPLRTNFSVSNILWIIVFSFLFLPRFFLKIAFYFIIKQLIIQQYILFSFHLFEFFTVIFLQSISSLIVFQLKNMLDMISIFLNLLKFILWPSM